MTYLEPVSIRRNALRQLAHEARQRLAAMELHAPERDFYLGVEVAAEDLARSYYAAPRSLKDESADFRSGYLQVQALNAASAGHSPVRFPLPSPRA